MGEIRMHLLIFAKSNEEFPPQFRSVERAINKTHRHDNAHGCSTIVRFNFIKATRRAESRFC